MILLFLPFLLAIGVQSCREVSIDLSYLNIQIIPLSLIEGSAEEIQSTIDEVIQPNTHRGNSRSEVAR